MKKTILKWILLLLLMGYATWMIIWTHERARRDVCVGFDVEVKGNSLMDSIVRKGLETELRNYPKRIAGTPIMELDADKIEKHLKGMNLFEEVSCMLTSDNRLLVQAVPVVPVMRIFTNDKSYYINKSGKYIEALPEFYTNVPIVSGNFTKKFTPKEVLPLVQKIESNEFLREVTGMIIANDRNNLLIVPRIRGHVVNFGDTSRLDEKIDMLKLFYRKVMPKKGWNVYDTISVKYRDQIVATRRIKPVVKQEAAEEEVDLEEQSLSLIESTQGEEGN